MNRFERRRLGRGMPTNPVDVWLSNTSGVIHSYSLAAVGSDATVTFYDEDGVCHTVELTDGDTPSVGGGISCTGLSRMEVAFVQSGSRPHTWADVDVVFHSPQERTTTPWVVPTYAQSTEPSVPVLTTPATPAAIQTPVLLDGAAQRDSVQAAVDVLQANILQLDDDMEKLTATVTSIIEALAKTNIVVNT